MLQKGRLIYRGMPAGVRIWEIITAMITALISRQNPLAIWVNSHKMENYIEHLKIIAVANNSV